MPPLVQENCSLGRLARETYQQERAPTVMTRLAWMMKASGPLHVGDCYSILSPATSTLHDRCGQLGDREVVAIIEFTIGTGVSIVAGTRPWLFCMLAMIGSGVDGQCTQCSRRTWTALPAWAEGGVGTKMQIIRPSKRAGFDCCPKACGAACRAIPEYVRGADASRCWKESLSGRLVTLIGNNWRLRPLDSARRVQHHSCQFLRKRSSIAAWLH